MVCGYHGSLLTLGVMVDYDLQLLPDYDLPVMTDPDYDLPIMTFPL